MLERAEKMGYDVLLGPLCFLSEEESAEMKRNLKVDLLALDNVYTDELESVPNIKE